MELLISGPEGSFTTVQLSNDLMSLGRAAENHLAYPDDPWLSRYHLCFERKDAGWFVKDCASRNGTVVNSVSLREPHRLKAGDRIHAGHLSIEIRDSGAAQSNVISFVPQEREKTTREATIVTSLDQVLGKSAPPGQPKKEAPLTTSRVVRALIRAGQELAGHRPLQDLFTVILDLALSAMGAKRGVILTLEDGGELVVRASEGKGFTLSTSVRDRVLHEKCSLMISDALSEDGLRQQQSIVMQQVRSMMAVPLQTGDRVIGLIYVDNGSVVRPFSQEDLDLLTVMANVAAIRIDHARLSIVEQSEKLMELELTQASEIQNSLLPARAPAQEGYDLAGFNLPCRTIGGDYYDFLRYKDGRLGLVVGDVSGKGLPASLLMSSLQARVHMLVETAPDPDAAITTLNRNLAEHCPVGKFISFFYGLLDPATGVLRYSNAGHNYPLVLRRDGTVEELKGNGLLLGIRPSEKYDCLETKLERGEMLALYSDGVTEACTAAGEEFGEQGLGEFLAARNSDSCADIVNALANHVRTWCGNSSLADDFTIVLARRH